MTDPVSRLADAVLFEGYMLWPYRRSALKNRRHFTFGDVGEPMRTQVLLEAGDPDDVEVTVRYLIDDVVHEVASDLRAERAGHRWRLTVDIVNDGPQTFHGTHAILRTRRGRFVSAREPESAGCENVRLWPVLVGDDAVLASPIILDDHPRIASESPGDLFDGGEIDALLTLNIMALTDDEKAEMREDPRTRAILERTEALTREQLMQLHGFRRER